MTAQTPQQIPISKIKPNPFNERKHIAEVGTLVNTMKKKGFWGTLLAREVKGGYEIAYGERRLKAAKMAGFKELPLQIKEMDDQEMRENTVIENVNREDVDPVERAKHLLNYQKKYKCNERTMANIFGMHFDTVNKLLTVAKMSNARQKDISDGKIGWSTAFEANKHGGEKLIQTAIKQKLTREDIRNIGDTIKAVPKEKERLITGRVSPSELTVERIAKVNMKDPFQFANELARVINRATTALEVFEENKDHFNIMNTHIVATSVVKLAKKLGKDAENKWKKKLDL